MVKVVLLLHRLQVVDCPCESDLEVPVEELAAERDPGGEHLQGHEAHRLAVHQEPLQGGGGQRVGRARPRHPHTHLLPRPVSGV